MRLPACVYCTGRKIRCDHQNPCSNCSKRQQECIYAKGRDAPRPSPFTADSSQQLAQNDSYSVSAVKQPSAISAGDAVIVREENQTSYLENPIWRLWNGRYFGPLDEFTQHYEKDDFVLSQRKSSLFSSVFGPKDTTFRGKHPSPNDAAYLWDVYFDRVNPITKVFFEQEVSELRSKCIAEDYDFPDQNHALIFAIYLLAVQSLLDDDDDQIVGRRPELLHEYQTAVEQALVAFDFLKTYDVTTIRVLVIYLYALLSQGTTIGLWDILGIITRKCETLGIHREGTILGLAPFNVEINRRLWWSIQELDLSYSSMVGATSMSLLAEWDSQLPLNIEDEDIGPEAQTPPKERHGITSMSHCLWRYSCIQQQISLRGPDGRKLGVAWAVNSKLSVEARKTILERLETDLNSKFLQHCDPIQDLDLAILINARSTMNFFRRAILSPGPAFKSAKHFTKAEFQALLEASVRMLKYDRERYINPQIKRFQWHWHLLAWNSLIHVLIELRKEENLVEAEKLWDVSITTYQASSQFKTWHQDKRKIYVAKLLIDAWKHLQNLRSKLDMPLPDTPDYLVAMQQFLVDNPLSLQKHGHKRKRAETPPQASEGVGAVDLFLGNNLPDFENLDWLFWEDGDQQQSTAFAASAG